jgi:hypothetical protein
MWVEAVFRCPCLESLTANHARPRVAIGHIAFLRQCPVSYFTETVHDGLGVIGKGPVCVVWWRSQGNERSRNEAGAGLRACVSLCVRVVFVHDDHHPYAADSVATSARVHTPLIKGAPKGHRFRGRSDAQICYQCTMHVSPCCAPLPTCLLRLQRSWGACVETTCHPTWSGNRTCGSAT